MLQRWFVLNLEIGSLDFRTLELEVEKEKRLALGSNGGYGSRDEDSRKGVVSMEWREFLCKNSWVSRWLWRLEYDNGSVLVIRLVTKSLNSPRRPRNTHILKSSRDMGRPTTTNSSNNDLACCMFILTNETPYPRSWKEPWSCMMRELDGDAKVFSRVCQTHCGVW